MKHVAFVIPGIDRIGGAERQAILLAGGLVRRGWRVSLIALSGEGGDARRELEALGVNFVSLGMRKGLADPRGWLRMRRWLHRNTPDGLHAHLPHGAWMARLARLLAPVPIVVDTMHTASTGSIARRLLYRLTARLTDCVTAVSPPVANACISARMIPAARMAIIPNGIDTERWRPDAEAGACLRARMRIQDRFVWLAAGRLEPVKDYDTLLEAFAGLPQAAHLVIAGTGSLESELRERCRRLAIDSRVLFLGFTRDVMDWMQAADAFALTSRWEGLPMCLLEAGACALPSVATDVAGSGEIVIDGETGFLCRPGDAESVRRAMNRLMQMAPTTRLSMSINARRRIEQQFGLESVLDRWEQLYTKPLLREKLPSGSSRQVTSTPNAGTRESTRA